jgi:hypothetical protein
MVSNQDGRSNEASSLPFGCAESKLSAIKTAVGLEPRHATLYEIAPLTRTATLKSFFLLASNGPVSFFVM